MWQVRRRWHLWLLLRILRRLSLRCQHRSGAATTGIPRACTSAAVRLGNDSPGVLRKDPCSRRRRRRGTISQRDRVQRGRIPIARQFILVQHRDRLTQCSRLQQDHPVTTEPHKPDRLRRVAVHPLLKHLARGAVCCPLPQLALRLAHCRQHHPLVHADQYLVLVDCFLDWRGQRIRVGLLARL